MEIKKALAVLSGLALMAAIACQGAVPAAQPPDPKPGPGAVAPTETPLQNLPPAPSPDADVEMAEVLAPIESVEINIAESFPPQYFVAIKSGLPSGCAQFNDYEVTRNGNTFNIKVTNLEPAPGQLIACTMIYGYHDTSINLGSDLAAGETYSVVVNDSVTETLIAQDGGNTGTESGFGPLEIAPIEALSIDVNNLTGDAELVVRSGLPNSCYEFGSASLVHDGDTIRVDVSNAGPTDQNSVCMEIYRTVETHLAINALIEPCETYTVVANGEESSVQAIAPNVRCAITEPIGQPMPPEPAYDTVVVPAPIESVLVISTRSLPPQYAVRIISGLPSGCAKFNDYELVREGNEIRVSVTNLMPAPDVPVMCTQIYGYQDTSIDIGSDFEDGVMYSVLVNEWPAETFVGQGGDQLSQSGIEIPLGKSVEVEIDGLALEFVEVTEDSRCPANVVCVWAGQAKILVAASEGDQDLGEHELLLDTEGAAANSVMIGDHSVALVALAPYPGTSGSSENADYVATVSVSQTSSTNDPSTSPEATVWAEPVANKAGSVTLYAEIIGGPDNNEDLYCVGTEWQFGDGNGMASMPGCIAWTPTSTIQRHFEIAYDYEEPGTYEVEFSHGTVSATTTIEVN